MKNSLKTSYQHVYFIGIGGVSMSGLAEILLHNGKKVSGSDMKASATTEHLKSIGTTIYIGHKAENITDDIDLVIYTAAIKPSNPEIISAKEKGIETIDRAELLGEIMRCYPKAIAVSGTHGKTTTTSMISEILLAADTDPTIQIGGNLSSIGGNIRIGSSEYFIAEACEYFDSFLKFDPYVAVILNVEADHLDYFKDIQQIRQSFHKFASKVPADGTVVINLDIPEIDTILKGLQCHIWTVSGTNPKADWTAHNVCHDDLGRYSFDVYYHQENLAHIQLSVPGDHNVSNALAAYAAAYAFHLPTAAIVQGLHAFHGAERRFQLKGNFNGVTVVDDYAHHPTEIKATLKAAKSSKHEDLWVVFQPHTYSRTKFLLNDFCTAFQDADHIIIGPIFAAREKDTGEISGQDVADGIKSTGKDAIYLSNFTEIESYCTEHCHPGDLLITMGAGDVYLIGENLVKA
ncbi:MAG: UDP-N-acetylmuramate--L-alanine ligase [Clostridiales bacterium]|nr:UDP-N-acetylmuramate--L-alanine ligase [Clostridiales bacterium]